MRTVTKHLSSLLVAGLVAAIPAVATAASASAAPPDWAKTSVNRGGANAGAGNTPIEIEQPLLPPKAPGKKSDPTWWWGG